MRPGRRQGRQGRDGRRGVAVASAVAAALEAWKSVRKHRYTPPSVEAHLRQTGKAVAERGLWNIGMDLLQRARVWKVKVSLDVYKDVLKACERSAQDRAAVKLLELLQDAQTAPDLETYRLVVSSILRARELVRRKSIKSKLDFPVDDVELTEVLEEMWEELPEASPTLQLSALEIIASTGDLPRALQAFEAMEQELHAFYALLVASGQAKQPQATKVILNEAIQRFGHEALLYQKGVLSLWTAGAPKDALKLIEVARQRGIRVDPLMCEAAIYSCVVLNRKPAMLQPWVEEAYATLNEEPKAEAVSAMARALARADDWQTALKLVDYLRDCGARADASVMNAVIHACHRLGQGQKALQVFETMVSNFLTPDALSYHIAILQLVKERSDNAAQLLYREVTRRRLCPAWITGKTSICVTGLNDELAAIATHIFLEEVSKTLVLRNLRITISAESLVDSPHDKAIKKKLTKLISREYGLRPDLLPAGEIWINRLEVKKWKGKMEPRKRKIRKSETALDFSWKVAERVGEEEPLRRPNFEESESEEEDNILTDISELSAQEVKLCLKEYGVTKFNDVETREQLVAMLEKVEDSLPLLGTWQHGRHTKQYEIQQTEDGQLLWEGPHIFGGTLVGVLYEDADWLRAELFTCKEESEQVGSVKISHGPDWHETTLKFMPSNSDQWGDDIVAKRSSKEQTPRRPKPLPAIRDLDCDEFMESQYWESLEVLSQALRVEHAALPPLERRAKSWARSVAFAQMTLGMRGIPMKGGAEQGNFVIWVLGATCEVEVSLAEQGYFKDMNWLDRAPTKVYSMGENLLEDCVEEGKAKVLKETVSASVTKEDAATYVVVYSRVFVRDHPSVDGKYVGDLFEGTEVHGREEGGWLRLDPASAELCVRIRQKNSGPTWVLIDGRQLGLGRLLEKKVVPEPESPTGAAQSALPIIRTACYEDLPSLWKSDPPDLGVILMPNFTKTAPEDPQQGVIPNNIFEMLGGLPVVVSSRCRLQSLNSLADGVLLPQMRCPFSAGAGDPSLKYDDNGWIFCATANALAKAALVCPEPALPTGKVKIMFWGIVDLKYDHHKPLLERIRVLETGDGRISRFSGDGAPIQKHFEDHYQLQEQEAALQTYNFISKDKKLTHDLFDATGYAHIIPRQVCFPRVYYPGIASHISAELGLREEDEEELVVLKLCNRSRAAGVLIVPLKDLEKVLQEILEPPAKLQSWFEPQLERLKENSARDFGVVRDSFEEHVRHWWANESPSFVAERCCSSMPTMRDGRCYDGTMRVTFALRRRPGASETLTPEDIEVDWLGGYWKLPNADMSSSLLRERIISQAKTGTAPVQPYILMEVYGALSSALQQLFGAAEFTSERLREQYKSQPELAAYLIARRALSLRPEQRLQSLCDVERSIARFTVSPAKSCVESFVHRAHGVLIARGSGSERWKEARGHFQRAVDAHPSNSNALFQLGMCALELGPLEMAIELMNKSLLLDSDFRAPYVNLGVAYLRQAAHADDPHKAQDFYLRAMEISKACLMRHPASPQCNYHIGVACTQLAFYLQDGEGVDCKDARFIELRGRAAREFLEARGSVEAARRLSDWQEAQARGIAKKQQAPWLSVDDKMLQAVEVHMMQGQTLKPIKIPEFIGWRLFFWRV